MGIQKNIIIEYTKQIFQLMDKGIFTILQQLFLSRPMLLEYTKQIFQPMDKGVFTILQQLFFIWTYATYMLMLLYNEQQMFFTRNKLK